MLQLPLARGASCTSGCLQAWLHPLLAVAAPQPPAPPSPPAPARPQDYSHEDVTAENFLAVLAGNASALNAGRRSTRRVLATGPNDKVFVYYSGAHGASGVTRPVLFRRVQG